MDMLSVWARDMGRFATSKLDGLFLVETEASRAKQTAVSDATG